MNAVDRIHMARAMLLAARGLNGTPPNDVSKGFKVSVDPHALVETILVDPRAPDEFVQAYQHYFRDKLGFVGRIAKSALYADREPIEVL